MGKTTMKLKPVAAKPDPVVFRCPECGSSPGDGPSGPSKHAICPACAAISIRDPRTGAYRSLLTEEWVELSYGPAHYDFMERRFLILERITDPW